MGNVCRSAFAEFYLRNYFLDYTDNTLKIESCGLKVIKSGSSPQLAISVSEDFGVDLRPHRSKSHTSCDFNSADQIIPMEYEQYLQLIKWHPEYKEKIRLLQDFSPWSKRIPCNIYDPYGLGKKEFNRCFKRISVALDQMAFRIKRQKQE